MLTLDCRSLGTPFSQPKNELVSKKCQCHPIYLSLFKVIHSADAPSQAGIRSATSSGVWLPQLHLMQLLCTVNLDFPGNNQQNYDYYSLLVTKYCGGNYN